MHPHRLVLLCLRPRARGQSVAEFALVLPILLLIFFGIFDLGRMLFLYSQVSNGAREAARYGSLVGLDAVNPQYVNCAGIRNAALNTMALNMSIPASNIIIEYDDGATKKSFTCDSGASKDLLKSGDRVRVTINAQYQFALPFLKDAFGPLPISYTAARTILRGGTLVGGGSN